MWIHAVDLDAGATFEDLPAGLIHELLSDVTADLGTREGGSAITLAGEGSGHRWHIKADDESPAPTTVQGLAHALLGWLLGRCNDAGLSTSGPPVTVPRWL